MKVTVISILPTAPYGGEENGKQGEKINDMHGVIEGVHEGVRKSSPALRKFDLRSR